MADNVITHGAPGVAEFNSETWGNATELRLQDTPALAYHKVTLTASGADLTLPIYSVVDANGLAAYQATVANKTVVGILPQPVFLADGASMDVYVLVAGNLDINALVWDDTFDTAEKKMAAFDGLTSPINMILGENKFNSDGVLA